MDKQKYASAIINTYYRASFWTFVSVALLISNVLLSVFVVTADTSEKTIIVPPDLEKSFFVKGDELSPEYIEQMAKYFSQLLLTYHKQNAQSQFNTILRHTNPLVYGEMNTRFLIEVERILRNDISSVFYLMGIHIKNNSAVLIGEQLGMVGSQVVSKNKKTYQINFNYDSGKLTIVGFNEVIKTSSGKYEVIKEENQVMIDPPDFSEKIDTEVKNDKK